MKFDYTRKEDAEYVIGYAVSLNEKGVREAAVQTYGANPGIVNTAQALTAFLLDRYNDGLDISTALNNVTVDPNSVNGADYVDQVNQFSSNSANKPFAETFVGSLLAALLFPSQSSGGGVPVDVSHSTTIDYMKIVYVFAGIFVFGIIVYAALRVFKK